MAHVKLHNYRTLLFAVLVTFIPSACRKTQYYHVSEQARREFGFKLGSYWVYRDMELGSLDSCVAARLDSTSDVKGYHEDEVYYYEHLFFWKKPDTTGRQAFGTYRFSHTGVSEINLPFESGVKTTSYQTLTYAVLPSVEIESNTYRDVYAVMSSRGDTILLKPQVGYLRLQCTALDSAAPNGYIKVDYRLVRYNVKM